MDAVARALAEPRRRAILEVLGDGELTAGAIAANFDVSRPAISQHLRVLHDADLVAVRREGTRRYYELRPESMCELRDWMDGFWTGRLRDLKREVEQERWRDRRKGRRRSSGAATRSAGSSHDRHQG
ncbi:MAG: metalloregulator ArsR/SmtB family transcription factor [Acidimicrobiia bacterium]|nr:metalloregulator ArsR/SmtB family transcription factor [Acidimicrobiia bacterium]